MEIDQDAQELRIVDEKKGAEKATYRAAIPFADVSSVAYERSKSPRVKTAIFLSPLALFSSGKKHWLTIETKVAMPTCGSTRRTSADSRGLGAAGFDVETLIED